MGWLRASPPDRASVSGRAGHLGIQPSPRGGPELAADEIGAPVAIAALSHGSSIPVRQMPNLRPEKVARRRVREVEVRRGGSLGGRDGALQKVVPATSTPGPLSSFEGISNGASGFSTAPPDTSGDVGPTQYVEAVNVSFAVYSKSGALVKGPTHLPLLWAGLSQGLCSTHDDGDPVVVYDRLANRWLISQFAVEDPDDYEECVAVSKTGDAAGAYWTYDFKISTSLFDDYPKFGVWRDGYYASFNDFGSGPDATGATVAAFDRDRMLNGQPASFVKFELGPAYYSLLPAHVDSRWPPPAGEAAPFVEETDGPDQLDLYAFHVDFASPQSSSFGHVATLPVASFDSGFCATGAGDDAHCIQQKDTGQRLDPLADRPLQRLDYRNLTGAASSERLVFDQTVDVGSNRGGVRWYELRRSGSSWTLGQQGTWAPADGLSRWMGSTAMDGSGDIAAGYSTSSSTAYPSLRYAGRVPTDAAGTLAAERVLVAGTGSQSDADGRWGDYTTMSVDPLDDCTFWYVGQYYATTSWQDWHTRVGSFRFPSCVGISRFAPSSGRAGTAVTITGVGFTGASVVRFHGAAAPATSRTATQLKVTVPAAATSGRITVTNGATTVASRTSFIVGA